MTTDPAAPECPYPSGPCSCPKPALAGIADAHQPAAPLVLLAPPPAPTPSQLLQGFAFGCGAAVGLLVTVGLTLSALGVELPSRNS
jgi:hypothetical protein